MARKSTMTGNGSIWAGTPLNGVVARNLTAAGADKTNPLQLTADLNEVKTAALGTGVRVPTNMEAGDSVVIVNYGANAVLVYPTLGGSMEAGAADAPVSVAAGASAVVYCIAAGEFAAVVSA